MASKLPRNKKYFKRVETKIGEKLNWEQKIQTMQARKAAIELDRQTSKNQELKQAKQKQFTFSFKYFATIVLVATICLSTTLPFVFKDAKTIYIEPDVPGNTLYTEEVSILRVSEEFMREMKDILLFSKEQTFFDFTEAIAQEQGIPLEFFLMMLESMEMSAEDFISHWGNSWMEFVDNTILGYFIKDLFVILSEDEIFNIDYRIRVYREYHFIRYVENNYSALVSVAGKHGNEITAETKVFIVEENVVFNGEIVGVISKEINTFIVNDIAVYCIIPPHEEGAEINAFIHFTYKGNDYFIRVDDKKLCDSITLDVDYIKNVFIPALFENIPASAGE